MCMWLSVELGMWVQVSLEVRGVQSSRAGVRGCCKSPNVGVRDRTWILCKSSMWLKLLSLLSSPIGDHFKLTTKRSMLRQWHWVACEENSCLWNNTEQKQVDWWLLWSSLTGCMSSDSYLLQLCTCLRVTIKVPGVLILGLKMNFSQ